MKEFEPTKKLLKKDGIVFLYLSSEFSPKKVWDNMIPTIPREHYRLTSKQMDYLWEKFNVEGVPSYMILS